MKMYVVLGENVWDTDTYVVGVYSTEKKAQEVINGVGKERFPNDLMWISDYEVDTFDWWGEE